VSEIFKNDIKFLPGVGPKRATLLEAEIKVCNLGDLLYYFPYKYIDRTKFYSVKEVNGKLPHIQAKGKITSLETIGTGKSQRLTGIFSDGTGELELVWFRGIKFVKQSLKTDREYIIFGKPTVFGQKLNIVHPEIEEPDKKENVSSGHVMPYYSTTEKLKKSYINSRTLNKLQYNALQTVKGKIWETLPSWLVKKLGLIGLEEALFNIHFPENSEKLKYAQYRLKFEELFFIQLKILSLKVNRSKRFKGHVFSKINQYFNTFYHNNLPFQLTGAQMRVLKEIRKDVGLGRQMNRLLQGDVGSGKTLVALMSALMALDNGYQACVMAPTEILANQHFSGISKFLKGLDVNIALLTGSTGKPARRVLHEQLLNGELQILVGTHALIEETVQFKNLGLVVVDEQHRFGVAQRARLWKKNSIPPHVLVMTATPIPRTLAMTVYGDLEVSVIDELPPGRKPVQTYHNYEKNRSKVFDFLKKEIAVGRQAYIVYPLIQESEKLDFRNLEEGYEHVKQAFPEPRYRVSMVHGKMKPAEKDAEMERFKRGETQIMVATTVIEVGVDVPNASVMVIESANRFGLAQLHQLRGRVGRGAEQSYCILMSSYQISNESRKRLDTMVRTNDGFELAEMDLKLRGPGDMEGTQQSGFAFDLKIANLGKDGQILQFAREIANEIIEADPDLTQPGNNLLKKQLLKMKNTRFNWSSIS